MNKFDKAIYTLGIWGVFFGAMWLTGVSFDNTVPEYTRLAIWLLLGGLIIIYYYKKVKPKSDS